MFVARFLDKLGQQYDPLIILFPINWEGNVKATQKPLEPGQSLWIDNITRDFLYTDLLEHFIEEGSVTGLTLNLSAFNNEIQNSTVYDVDIRKALKKGFIGQALLYELVLKDLRYTADLFEPIYQRTEGTDGWVSIDLTPLIANDTESIFAAAKSLHSRIRRPNVLINIPGTKENLPAIEKLIFTGIPVNIILLFSREQYLAAAEAFRKGIERRISAGYKPGVGSFAFLSVSAWDTAVREEVTDTLSNQVGMAIACRTYKASQEILNLPAWQRIYNTGAQPQRLLWANTGSNSTSLNLKPLATPFTVNTMSEGTFRVIATAGSISASMPSDGSECQKVLSRLNQFGIDIDTMAKQLQRKGVAEFTKSWLNLMTTIASKSADLTLQGSLSQDYGFKSN